DVLLGCVTHDPSQRNLFLFRDFVESFVEIGREADRRTDPGRALSLRAFSLSLFRLHRWPASIIVFTTVHHGGESARWPVGIAGGAALSLWRALSCWHARMIRTATSLPCAL